LRNGVNQISNLTTIREDFDLNVFPNPVSQLLNIETTVSEAYQTTIDLISASGQTIQSKKITLQKGFNSSQMNVSNVPTGMYFLRIYNNDNSRLQKVNIIH